MRGWVALSLALGCGVEPSPPVQAELDDAFIELGAEFGGDDGKADLFGLDLCDALEPLLAGTDATIRSGYLLGVEGTAVLGTFETYNGLDIVFDLYHHEMIVSYYAGLGVTGAVLAVSGEAYAGFVTGFEHGAADWTGPFVSAETPIGLPYLRSYVSLRPSVFASGVDRDGNGVITPVELVVPPGGVYGFRMGVAASFVRPRGVRVPVPVSRGVPGARLPFAHAIRWYYDRIGAARFAGIGNRVRVRLVDAWTGEPCDPDWPEVEEDRACVIAFGEEDWSHTRRGLHMAYGICHVTGECTVPIAWPMASVSVAVGAIRDTGDDVSERCAELATSDVPSPEGAGF